MNINILGAGGHAKVVISTLRALGHEATAVYDDDPKKHGEWILGVPVKGGISEAPGGAAVIAIGSNKVRAMIAERFAFDWQTLIHPAASVDPSVRIGHGAVVFAGAVVQPDAILGEHAVINTASSVDHDCVISSFAQLAPGAHLGGNVNVGEGAFIGIGACVIQGIRIGEWTVVGAGSAVTRDLPANVTAVGAPCRPVAR